MKISKGFRRNVFVMVLVPIAIVLSTTAILLAANARTKARANSCQISKGMITAISGGQKKTLPAKACINGQIVTSQCGRNKMLIQKTETCTSGCESIPLKNKSLIVRCKADIKALPSATQPVAAPSAVASPPSPQQPPVTPPPPITTPPEDTLAYSHGTCPRFVEGENSFQSGSRTRKFLLRLPARPVGAPVMFVWHGWGGTPQSAMDTTGIHYYQSENFILVAPYAAGHPNPEAQYEWFFASSPANNPDLIVFDDIIACLNQQYSIDLNRIWSTGFSAGGLWTSYLTQYRANILASTVALSGGLDATPPYHSPSKKIPVLLEWGGTNDLVDGFSFEQAALRFSQNLRADGSFVVECDNLGGGHSPPQESDFVWMFLRDHPKGVSPEPYDRGLPRNFPSWCRIP